jgi:DNA-binding ferritin-like protein
MRSTRMPRCESSSAPADVTEQIRGRMDRLGEIDLASQDVLIEVVRELEKELWMLRSSLPA